jgi:glycosyltransferase involved in cell wall biosynthesis
VIAVPHIRMSGASRVAAIFARALATIRDRTDILVITTDSSEAEYAAWFPDDIRRYDLSAELGDLSGEMKAKLLVDLVRGVRCRTLVNVNSRLVWDSLRLFGRQISAETSVVTYFFTWEETPEGDRVGYPIQWLHDTSNFHRVLFTDTRALARDISDRLGFDRAAGAAEVRPLRTPVEEADKAVPAAAVPVDPDAPPRFLWAGRFDPQKRVDLLVEIARRWPEATFDVYGKAVLGRGDLAAFDPPANIHAKGTYTDLDEVLTTPYAGFVYTAQWDGLPTILLDLALRDVPIVAPRVGGIAELIDSATGWLVEDFADVDAYGAALAEMAGDPREARRRAARLKARIGERYSLRGYRSAIREVMDAHGL